MEKVMRMKGQIGPKQAIKNELRINQNVLEGLHVLALPLIDLYSFVRQQVEENPLLEWETFEWPNTDDWNLIEPDLENSGKLTASLHGDEKMNLQDRLFEQLADMNLGPGVKAQLLTLIGSLDEQGFLKESDEVLKRILHCNSQDFEQALEILHSFDPPGVGARDMFDCLRLQLRSEDQLAAQIVSLMKDDKTVSIEDLPDLLACDPESLDEALMTLAQLNLVPFNGFAESKAQEYVLPEARVVVDEGGPRIDFQWGPFKRLKLVTRYDDRLDQLSELDQHFIIECKRKGKDLLERLNSRFETCQALITYLVHKQLGYLLGQSSLEALSQKDLADLFNIHPSTISRALKDKYIISPIGPVLLRELLAGTAHGQLSPDQLKDKIRTLVQKEDKTRPLSDQAIADLLKADGFNLSRRLVNQYRKDMMIPSSRNRKEKES